MATTLQIVDTDLTTVLFDFNDSTGAANPNAVKTTFGTGGLLSFDPGDPDVVVISPTSAPGGEVVYRRDPLGQMSWRQRFYGVTYDNLAESLGVLADMLAGGGVLKFIPHGSSNTRYVDFEPSRTPVLFDGREMGLWQLLQANDTPEGIVLALTTQPYMRGAALTGSTNLVNNGTLTHDFGGTANRPDGWTWDSTTNLTAESITTSKAGGIVRGVYQFTKSTGTAANLQFTTADNTYASGDVGVFSFYARVVSGTSCQMQATLQFQTNAAANVGGLHSGGLVTLTSAWQRFSVTSTAAGATTGQALVSIQIDDTDANPNVVQVCNAQAEKTSLTEFHVAPEAINADPASTTIPRRMAVFAAGTAPTTGRLTFTADAQTLGEVSVYRETINPITILQQTGHKQLESGSLGTGTASAADANASGGNTAEVTYPATTPALDGDSSGDISATTTVTVTKPSGVNEGDYIVVAIHAKANTQPSISAAPAGWAGLGSVQEGGLTAKPLLAIFGKVATNAEPASWTWTLNTASNGRWWGGVYSNIDQDDPVDTIALQTNGTGSSVTINIPSVTTTRDNNRVIEFSAGASPATGTFTVTPPAGTTPTYTEQEDGVKDIGGSTFFGLEVADGNLATAGATGAKTTTASIAVFSVSAQLALNSAPAIFEERVRQTWSSPKAGDYDVWLRFYPTAASIQRLECEWAPVASPSVWNSMGEFVVDTSNAAAFAYVIRKLGRIHIPSEWTVSTLTVRINSGLEVASSAKLRMDYLDLVPVNETASTLTAPGTVASGAKLSADPDASRTFHLDSSNNVVALGTASGAIPVPLEPGLNVLTIISKQVAATGFDDRAAVLTAAPTLTVDVTPRYR